MPRSTADIEKGKQSQGSETPALADPSEDAAATKLWAVYVSEAEKYDKALVESWKSDMEGMLIFAGLFSASLTAFIIESYPMLLPDSGDTTVQLLAQISQQLAAAANGSTFLLPQRTPAFAPPTASLVCNSFWFVSLGLSLSCALVATLVEQWARDFLHKADMRSAPAMRARIFSYLYYGLKRFSMHVVVDIIPLLLHASLLFFFAGLVAFLIPINIPMAAVAGAILALVTAMYSILTFLPLMYLDCPYRTPLSGAFWDLSRQTRGWFRRRHRVGADTSADKTAMGAMSHQAMHPSPERNARDYQALVWTVKSLADDNELEPFIEAIPDVVCGSQSLRWGYRDHIQNIIHNTDLALLPRLRGLLHSCHSGLLSGAVVKRRRTTYYRALWAMASLPPSPSVHMLLEFPEFQHYSSSATEWAYYVHSITLLVQWSAFLSAKAQVPNLLRDIAQLRIDIENDRTPELQAPISLIKSWWFMNLPIMEDQLLTRQLDLPPGRILDALARILQDLVINVPHRLLFRFLRHAALLKSPPFRYLDTRSAIALHPSASFSAWKDQLDMALKAAVYTTASDSKDSDWVDEVVRELCSYWTPDQEREPTPIPLAIIHYLNTRKSDRAIKNLVWSYLWEAYPITISTHASASSYLEKVLASLWRILSLETDVLIRTSAQSILAALPQQTFCPQSRSVIPMLKDMILRGSLHTYNVRDGLVESQHSLFPELTRSTLSELIDKVMDDESDGNALYLIKQQLSDRVVEAQIALLAEYIEGIGNDLDSLPYRVVDTLRYLGSKINAPRAAVHEVHQIGLADALARMRDHQGSALNTTEVLDAVVNSEIFDVYADVPERLTPDTRPFYPWLDDPIARSRMKDTLVAWANTLDSENLGTLLAHIRAIIAGLASPHLVEIL